ncbi:Heavy metal transport/detoxification superfamily protein [Rhynchospora pubera]|uniref:Heavy metal transport/detoxification superfamily protein n=1 Tax=Rhynchospora pubera TaxID=906938 RepID=A0AAV8FF60_9POAL|nr:Heavy metal transport/detoxification superfamily protein [Rhynchospora pubera]
MVNKQKMEIKLSVQDKKKRKKALTTAAGVDGIISVKLGDDNRLVVVGEGTDVIELTTLLRKKLGYAEVISVTSVEENPGTGEDDMPNTSTQGNNDTNYQHGVPSPYDYPYRYPHWWVEYN